MTYLLNLLEEGARPGVLTRRIELQGRTEVRLSLYLDLSVEQGRAPGLRRTLLMDADQQPKADRMLSLVGTLRCEIELGAFQVVFLPHRTPAPVERTVRDQWGQHLAPLPSRPVVNDADMLDFSVDFSTDAVGDVSMEEPSDPGFSAGKGSTGGAASGIGIGAASNTGGAMPPAYFISILLPDGSVRPLGREERPDSGTRFRIRRQFRQPSEALDAPPVTIELNWSDEESQELGRVRTGSSEFAQRVQKDADVAWQIPEASQALETPFNKLVETIQIRAAKAGISTAILFAAVGVISSVTAAVGYSLYVHRVAAEAENSASAALEESTRASDAASSATQREQECLTTVAQNLKSSGDIGNAEREQARIRLAPTLGEIEFRRTWGEPPSHGARDDLARRQRLDGLLQLILERRAGRRNEQLAVALNRQRLLFANNARPDLPTHVLFWHTHPRQAEASGFFREETGIDFRGFWGLSSRVKREFERSSGGVGGIGGSGVGGTNINNSSGLSAGAAAVAARYSANDASSVVASPSGLESVALASELRRPDPRDRDDWSANTHLEGLRRVRHAILTADTGGRLPVYPEQLHVWTMAVWYAYNYMPDLKSGRVPSVSACVENLLLNLALFRLESPDSAEPVLPDMRDVLNARAWTGGPLGASALCPWREERLFEGARHAIDSVADLWLMEESENIP